MKLVVYGLTVTSSWGNGHATTYRSLLKALHRRGHQIHFVEKNVEWYRSNRDLPKPAFCTVHLYDSWDDEGTALLALSRDADAVIVGSYFPNAIEATRLLVESYRSPVLFYDIDTPITITQLRRVGGTEYLSAELIPQYAAYLSFTGGPTLQELEHTFGARQALAFYCSVDPDMYHPTEAVQEFKCHLSYLGTYAPDRQPKLMELLNEPAQRLPGKQFMVAGPQYPEGIPWADNVERIIHLSPPQHPSFYSSSQFTLNVTRDDMVAAGYSPSVRLFEASACGATILSDYWAGLDDFLEAGEEILLPTDADDVVKILREIPDEERIRIGQRARQRILDEHTSEHRARQFEEVLAGCVTSQPA
ncbi:MAG TPA: glycosyltransferase [Acidobacteriaceae bacterium]|nr:glycosyltransferase [Acidobacteriaceae bacterium]